MAIAVKCPHCEKRFKLADSLAGKKGKCSGCGGVLRIPNAPPPLPTRPKSDLDLYDLDEGTEAQTEPDMVASEPTGKAPLEAGANIASMTIEECSASRLVLACRPGRLLFLVLIGTATLIAGFVMLSALEAYLDQSTEPRRILLLMLFVPLGLMGIGAGSFCYIGRIGYRTVFDLATRTFSVQRLYTFGRSWRADELGGVVFRVGKPWNEDEDYAGNKQTADAFVIDRDGRAVALLDRVSINKPKFIVPLARACLHAGHLLRMPVHVELAGPPIGADMRRAVELIKKSAERNASRPVPKVRPPLVTTYTAATLVGTVVILVFGGRFFIERSTDFHQVRSFMGASSDPQLPPDAAPQPQDGTPQVAAARPSDPGALKVIDGFISDMRAPDPQTRRFAAFHLTGQGVLPERRDEVCELLRNMAASDVEEDRKEALAALGRWGTDADLATLIAELDSPRMGVREGAAKGLVATQNPLAANALVKRLLDLDRRSDVANHLSRFGPAAESAVASLLDTADDALTLTVSSILENIGTPNSLPALQAALARRPKPGPAPADPFGPAADKHRADRALYESLERAASNAGTRKAPSGP